MFLDFFTPSPKQLKNWLRFANVGFNLCTQISVSEFNCRMVFCVIATLMLGKWKAPIDCLGNDVRNIAAENPSTHHPAWFFPSKWLLYLHLDGALFKGCYRDQRENFQSLQAMSCWLLSHWRLVILHATCVPCFLFVCFVHITHMFVSIQAQSYVQLFLGISSERHRNCAALQHQQPYLEHVVPPSATYFEGGLLTYSYILYSIHIIYTQISKSNQAFHLSCWYVVAFLLGQWNWTLGSGMVYFWRLGLTYRLLNRGENVGNRSFHSCPMQWCNFHRFETVWIVDAAVVGMQHGE